MKIERIVIALFLLALMARLTSVYYAYVNFNTDKSSAAIATHTHNVIETTYLVEMEALEVENAFARYARSNDSYTAGLLRRDLQLLDKNVQNLLDSAKDNRVITNKANEMEMQVAGMEKALATLQPSAENYHLSNGNSAFSDYFINNIISNSKEIIIEENISLSVWRKSVRTSRRNTINDVYYAAAAGLIFVIIILLALNKDIRRRKQAEEKIRENEEKLRRMVEEVGDVIYSSDYKGKFTFINARFESLTGYSISELLGKELLFVVHPGWKEKVKEFYFNQFKNRIHETRYEFPVLTKQGETKWVEQNAVLVSKGKMVESFQCVVRDITRRKQTEEEIKRTNQFLDSILENIPNMIFIKDGKDLRFLRFNKAGEKLLGRSQEEMTGKTDYDFFPKEQADFFTKKDMEVLNSRREADIPEEPINTSQGPRWLHTKKIPVYDAAGTPLYLLGISEDITEKKKAEDTIRELHKNLERYVDELEESQRFYRTIAHNFPDGTISVLDRNMKYLYVDGMELQLEGLSSEKLVGTFYLNRFPSENREEIKQKLLQIFEGRNVAFEAILSGNFYIIHGVPLRTNHDGVTEILLVKQNVNKLKQAEEDIKTALEKERMINELKSRFVSLASHEFRTPLSTILSSTELIEEYIEHVGKNPAFIKDKNIHHLKRIKSAIQNMVTILNNFLSLDQLEQGKTLTNPLEFDVREFAEKAVDSLRQKLKSGQNIVYSHLSDASVVFIDRAILENVTLNLLTNAIKYSPENTVINYTTRVVKNGLEFTVEDHGIGIPQTEQANLFERFFRAKNTLNIEGTGLGLSIVKKYIDLLNGHISFTSRENEGSIFKVFIANAVNQDENKLIKQKSL